MTSPSSLQAVEAVVAGAMLATGKGRAPGTRIVIPKSEEVEVIREE